jgi:hypothetical protein
MPQSILRLIKSSAEFLEKENITKLRYGIRGIYVLYNKSDGTRNYDVAYIGMSSMENAEGIRFRLRSHAKSKRKRRKWTHFSIFEVWDNITNTEIRELEGLFRHIYRRDSKANILNTQKGFGKLRDIAKMKNDILRD